jgi:hypothetical protein
MKAIVRAVFPAVGLLLATPAAAQEQEPGAQAAMMAMLEDAFATEPLTPAQEARLPEATKAVALVVPVGFYARLMDRMMKRMLGPLFGHAAVMSTEALAARVGLDSGDLPELDEDTRKRLTVILDPAAEQRADAISEVLTGSMAQIYSQLEGPMREGLAKAYAARFDHSQLADINAFFATPTGAVYASESVAAFTDPQMMGAMMQSLPLVMQQVPQMIGAFEAALAGLPEPRDYTDLSAEDRRQLATAFNLSETDLRAGMARAEQTSAEAGGKAEVAAEPGSEPELQDSGVVADEAEAEKGAAPKRKLLAE